MTELERKINNLVEEKQEKIIPSNIKKGIKIFGVEGEFEGESQPNVDISNFLGLKPIKKLTFHNSQEKLVNHYIEKFSTCQGFEDIPYYDLAFNIKPEKEGKFPYVLYLGYLSLSPNLLGMPVDVHSDFPTWIYYYHPSYTAAFIQLDSAMDLGLTDEFLDKKNITQDELLQLNGWYTDKLQPYNGVIEFNDLMPVYATIENAASMVDMADAPENAVKSCYTLDDFYLSVDIEYYDSAEDEKELIQHFIYDTYRNAEGLEARIAELEAEIAEANAIIDQLNGEEV